MKTTLVALLALAVGSYASTWSMLNQAELWCCPQTSTSDQPVTLMERLNGEGHFQCKYNNMPDMPCKYHPITGSCLTKNTSQDGRNCPKRAWLNPSLPMGGCPGGNPSDSKNQCKPIGAECDLGAPQECCTGACAVYTGPVYTPVHSSPGGPVSFTSTSASKNPVCMTPEFAEAEQAGLVPVMVVPEAARVTAT
ncbi:hypothetical protein CC1G_09471 [Coprinopsis cinerea okayama7|uniref:Secreted protein n=1 Tax=Coprinopsis cinerea (strain Okayama-7 / 130 / ATCC MYA-4618 / FGSC 9003) TaxID=240176 RepID=A8PDF1_COPC7|nr:hypothetical protein CC1G_09471 [Coprinopsis cinerea okayama7\|eukprot:XP_001840587.2 hypothetical protein CC1G_09471 [Coprinopsis cinerea okayama7\